MTQPPDHDAAARQGADLEVLFEFQGKNRPAI
jgi:hypothetical protein